jgi:hypothetical protein
MRQLLRYAGHDRNLISSRFGDAMDFNANWRDSTRDNMRIAQPLSLNKNLAVFAKFDPTSVVSGKSHRALRTAVGLNY